MFKKKILFKTKILDFWGCYMVVSNTSKKIRTDNCLTIRPEPSSILAISMFCVLSLSCRVIIASIILHLHYMFQLYPQVYYIASFHFQLATFTMILSTSVPICSHLILRPKKSMWQVRRLLLLGMFPPTVAPSGLGMPDLSQNQAFHNYHSVSLICRGIRSNNPRCCCRRSGINHDWTVVSYSKGDRISDTQQWLE